MAATGEPGCYHAPGCTCFRAAPNIFYTVPPPSCEHCMCLLEDTGPHCCKCGHRESLRASTNIRDTGWTAPVTT